MFPASRVDDHVLYAYDSTRQVAILTTLACAQTAECGFLVSGDLDLLILKQHGHTKIVTPAELLAKLQEEF